MADEGITADLPDELRARAEFAVAVGEAPSVGAYLADLASQLRESMDEVFGRWDHKQGVTDADRTAAEVLVRERMAADDARWASEVGGDGGRPPK